MASKQMREEAARIFLNAHSDEMNCSQIDLVSEAHVDTLTRQIKVLFPFEKVHSAVYCIKKTKPPGMGMLQWSCTDPRLCRFSPKSMVECVKFKQESIGILIVAVSLLRHFLLMSRMDIKVAHIN